MIRFVPWSDVGTITVSPGDNVIEVGAFELAEGADTLWVRMTNTGTPGPWPWSYGILSFKTDEGQPLGSIKAYNSFDGEVFRLGVGLPPSVRAGLLTFEPRGFNMAWIKQGNPWTLKFEAQSGSTSGQVTSYWNRDPNNGILSPVTITDEISTAGGTFNGNVLVTGSLETRGAGTTVGGRLSGYGLNAIYIDGHSSVNVRGGALSGDNAGVGLAAGSTAWANLSDERMKADLTPITSGLEKVAAVRAVTGRYVDDAIGVSRSFLIAQDVLKVLPEAVDASDPRELHLRMTEVIPLLVAALHDSKARIEALEAEIQLLKAS